MAFEKTLPAVPAQLFTANGTKYGQIQVQSTAGFKLKQAVLIKNNAGDQVKLEVKSVLSPTILLVGKESASLEDYADLTVFTTSTQSTIEAKPQNRQAIPPDKFWRAVFEESPTVAIRTFAVDQFGRPFSIDNPIPVQLSNGSVNIGTVNAQLETFLTHKDNDPHEGDVHSSIRIGDGVEEVEVNPDGSLNVVVVSGGKIPKPTKTVFNQVAAVLSGSETLVVTYTVPPTKRATLDQVTGSGENIGKYNLYLNGTLVDVQRTYWAGGFNVRFQFNSQGDGVVLEEGDVLELKVIHTSDEVGDFDGRIQLVELD